MTLRLTDLTPHERQHLETCVHEAGHAVAAALLGGRIHTAAVADSRVWGVTGKTVHDDVPDGSWASTVYAGPWAQARWRAGKRPTQREIYDVLATAAQHDDRALLASGGTQAVDQRLTGLLTRCWPGVVRVAQKLHRDGEATHADVCAALGITDGGGPGSVQLANIRAGLRDVPPVEPRRKRKHIA
ncbi:M50 family metallopeptidase [Mycolicibacterium elephantis]|uniref:Peptidase M41 domain-containing protein n=1 Tax=Mycolicibacterium elephantis DSM 44368 TaxID=1335622 RepID=A0A439DXY4_9MYCO|nr:M50 family metallopeptidase [Mycolicibacterium elephantis]MCV7223640.1 M50 family metallopeptidase [Mycolicibacterium elephantis]RWA22342.1 hypothetical protein MELE44368_13085 [Mycolicibacterium elephantis DSM 44368]